MSDLIPRLRAALVELYREVGSPAARVVSRFAADGGDQVGKSWVSELPTSARLPREATVEAFLAALESYHQRPGDPPAERRALIPPERFTLEYYQDRFPSESSRLLGADGGQAPPTPKPMRLGRPIGECSPTGPGGLEVHRAIDLPGHRGEMVGLPTYVPRAHDERLREAVRAAESGVSTIVTLVGGSSTGKTRACWEAIQPLATVTTPACGWRVWHPIDPSRPAAAAAELEQVGPYTVVWLNDAQHYLLPPGDPKLGERLAAGLRTLLTDHDRAPVLILGTLWLGPWATLTTPPDSGKDPFSQARELLIGTDLLVPDVFTSADLDQLRETAADDPRLQHAAEYAEAGRITQHLAGVPELLNRYRNAPPTARAIIDAAIDARRLGYSLLLDHAFLEYAAPGYLTDHEWNHAGEDWLEQALAYTAAPCHGVPGPVTRVRTRPGERAFGGPRYRLADYLEQTGRTERAAVFPPGAFWDATAATITDSTVLTTIGRQAEDRGRYRRAAQLYLRAVDLGDASALRELARLRECAGDYAGAEDLYQQAVDRGDTGALWSLAGLRERVGDHAGAEALAVQAADRGDTLALRSLGELREEAGDYAGAEDLYQQAADRGDTSALRSLAWRRERAGDHAGAEALAVQAADRGDTLALQILAQHWEWVGDHAGAEDLYQQAVDRGDTGALWSLAGLRERVGDHAGAEALAVQAADRGDTSALRDLARRRERVGDYVGAEDLYQQAADRGHASALRGLAGLRERVGDHVGAEDLYQQAVDRGDTGALWGLAWLRERVGDHAGAEALAVQAADRGHTFVLRILARRRERAGDHAGAEDLYRQAVDGGDTFSMVELACMRVQAGDRASAEALAVQIADCGDTSALLALARRRERARDHAGAVALYRQILDRGNVTVLTDHLARMREQAGDSAGVDRIDRWGLTDEGEPSEEWDLALSGPLDVGSG